MQPHTRVALLALEGVGAKPGDTPASSELHSISSEESLSYNSVASCTAAQACVLMLSSAWRHEQMHTGKATPGL